jgi:hypothetical protein
MGEHNVTSLNVDKDGVIFAAKKPFIYPKDPWPIAASLLVEDPIGIAKASGNSFPLCGVYLSTVVPNGIGGVP